MKFTRVDVPVRASPEVELELPGGVRVLIRNGSSVGQVGELIREVYALGETEVGWTMSEDPVINRGGCKVVTDTSQIDATLESRLATLIAPLLASARSVDELEDQE